MEKFILIVILLSLFKSSFALNICDSIWSRKTKELRQGNLNFYLSPCGNHLENDKIQELCDSDFSACISKFNGSEQIPFIKSLGSPITNTIEEGYSLHFNGPPCSASADASIVAIKFICDIGLYDDKISLLKTPGIDSCVFIFLWLSPSACPKSGTTSVKSFDACESHVQEINHTVNLNNMIRQEETFVIPSTPDRVYRFRLCSTLTSEDGCNGSVFCITSSDGSFISDLGFGTRDHSNWTVTTSYDHWMTNITLEYESIQAKVHFNFICTKGNPYIQLDSETVTSHNKKLIMFNVFTKQACSINVTECPLLSNSANYDLRGLLLKEWNVNNISITLCRPNHNCLHENDNICSTDGKISTKLQNHELIVEGREEFAQKVRLIYNTNNNCNGTNGSISFIYECNKEDLGPTLIETKNNCHYYFLWRTPFVCVRSLGEEMEVYLHTGVNKCLFGDLGIDLSSLYNEDGDIIIYDSSSNSSWAINICGKGLLGGYNGTCGANSAVCKLDNIPPLEDIMIPSKNSLNGVSVGQNNLINGMQMSQMLTLMYSSEEKCKDDEKQNLTSSFMFICGTKQLFSKPEFFPGNETCSHQFVWTTHLVCPVQSISCDIDGPNDTKINLGVLSGSNIDDDIIVKHDKAVFVLDVCRELQSSKLFYDCPVNSAACMLVSENGTEVSLGLGELRNPPYYNSTSKDIHLDYTMGSICSLDSSNHTHYSTRVIFRCDWGRRIFSMEYLGRLGCQYQFLVLTDAACPRKRTAITKDGCYISGNPNFPNEIIDFSQLSGSNSSLTFKDSDRNTFYINICDYLPGYDPFAAILKKPNGQKLMLGKKSNSIRMVEDLIYVEYIDGDKCEEDPTLKYSVIVRFVCPKYDSPMYLDIIQNGRCIYIFNVYTSFVCVDHRRKCGISTNEGYHYDFSPLIKPVDSSYVVEDSWRLNICQSVGSCGVVDKKSYPVSVCNGTNPSLYRVMSKGFLINEKLQLIYEHGEICPAEQNKTLSSVISFKCDPEIYPGYPSKIQDSDHCQINFEFPTALACKDLQIPYIYTAHSCKIYHAGRREFVDFSEVETHNAEFGWTLSPCQNPSCSVCGNGSSYGHIHSSQYDFHHESLIIENQGGSLCNDNATRRSSRIWFKCDRSLAKGEEGIVKLLYKNPCYAEFEWTMSLVCIPFEYEYENHFVEEVDSKSKYEEMIIIPVILIILSAIGGITYFKRKYGWNFFRTYRHRGFSPFVSYRRDLDTAYGDETLPSVPSSLSEDDNEQYKMI